MSNPPIEVIQLKRLLEEYGFEDGQYDPQIINQMLEFIGADVSEVLKTADIIREHTGHQAITENDLKIASKVSSRHVVQTNQAVCWIY